MEGLKSTNAQKLLIMQKTKFFKKIIFSFFLLTLSINVNSQCGCDALNCATEVPNVTLFNIYYGDMITMNAPPLPSKWLGGTGGANATYFWSTINVKSNDDPNSTSKTGFINSNFAMSYTINPLEYLQGVVLPTYGYFVCSTLSKPLLPPGSSSQCNYGRSFKVVFNAVPPPILNTSSDITICQGNTLQLSAFAQVGTIQWHTGSSSGPIIGTGNSITVSPNTNTTYYVNANNGNVLSHAGNSRYVNQCNSTSISVNVLVNQIPSSPIASNSGITCTGNALSLSATTITGATYNWTGPNGYTSSLQNPIVSDNATVQMAGNYTVTATVNGCSNTPATTNVIINQATINSNTTVCEGSTLALEASNISGASYYWTGPNGFSSISQNPTISPNATTNMAGVYSVYTTANNCTSPIPATINIVVTPKPSTPIPSNNGPVCVGNNLSLSVPSIAGATYQWTGPNSFISTIQNPNVSTSASTLMGGVYNVVTTIDGCSSNAGSTTIQINKITSTNNGPVCSGTTLSLGATAITGATYSWTGPNGFTSSQQNPIVSANSTSAMAGVYSVTSTVNGCTSPSSVTIASINPSPVTPVVTQIANTLNSSLAIGNQWYGQNGKIIGAVNQNYTPSGSGSYYVINTASGCSSTSSVFNYSVLANDEFTLSNDLKIYPNPTNSKINIDFGSQFNFIGSQVKVSNILGQEFYNSRINKQKTEISLSSVATKGLYFISIVNSEGKVIANKKIILN